MNTRSYVESHLRRGFDYDDTFTTMPHRAVVSRLERRLLRRIVNARFQDQPVHHLDFACGTGRILEMLSSITDSCTGLDVSASMLGVAHDRLDGVELIEGDLTRTDCLAGRRFDLVTAFRFFPNAEPPLRRDALRAIVQHLAPEGMLIWNNHLHYGSLARRIAVALGRAGATQEQGVRYGALGRGMSRTEAYDLAAAAGLRVEREYPLAVLPFTDRHMLRPAGVLEGLEILLSHVGFLVPLAQNLVYVCRRAESPS